MSFELTAIKGFMPGELDAVRSNANGSERKSPIYEIIQLDFQV